MARRQAASRSATRCTTPAACWSSPPASALIALAVLVPVGLLVGLGLWVAAALRRRRREQALDLI